MVFRLHNSVSQKDKPKAIPKATPEISQELIDYLNVKFPNELPTGSQATLQNLHTRLGWRSVVDHLIQLKRLQERSDVPEEHVHT